MAKKFLTLIILVLIAASALSQTNIDWKKIHKDLLRLDSCIAIGSLNDSLLELYQAQMNDYKLQIEILKSKNQLNETHISALDKLVMQITEALSEAEKTIIKQAKTIRIFGGTTATLLIILILFIAI